MCLLALAMTVKPLADEVANYIRCDRHKETDEVLHRSHLLPVARLEKGSRYIIACFYKKGNRHLEPIPELGVRR